MRGGHFCNPFCPMPSSLRSGHRAATRLALWKSSMQGRCLPSRGYSEHRATIGCGDPPSRLRSDLCNSKTASSSAPAHTATRPDARGTAGPSESATGVAKQRESGVKQRCKSKQQKEFCATPRFTSLSAVPVAPAEGGKNPWSTIIAARSDRALAVKAEFLGQISDLRILERCWRKKGTKWTERIRVNALFFLKNAPNQGLTHCTKETKKYCEAKPKLASQLFLLRGIAKIFSTHVITATSWPSK